MPTLTPSNPIVPGFYADPEARFYEGRFWIYATRSVSDYGQQLNIDAFSSADLLTWHRHEGVVEMADFPWVWRAVWAPTILYRGGRYVLIFASNDVQHDGQAGGLELAVSDSPAGPFRGRLGRPLIDRFIHGAQPIDAHLFEDQGGQVYLYYGGWKHCNVARMNDDLTGFVPLPNGETFMSVTPEGYVEGPCMLYRRGHYHFMWSEGDWVNGTYQVAYGVSRSPLGPFPREGVLLRSQPPVAEGPGHHGYLQLPGSEGITDENSDDWRVVYHRRVIGNPDPGARVLCIDRLIFDGDRIRPVVMT